MKRRRIDELLEATRAPDPKVRKPDPRLRRHVRRILARHRATGTINLGLH